MAQKVKTTSQNTSKLEGTKATEVKADADSQLSEAGEVRSESTSLDVHEPNRAGSEQSEEAELENQDQTNEGAAKSGAMTKSLSTTTFVIFLITILLLGLTLIGGMYYFLNIQYQKPKNIYKALGGPVTTKPASLTLEVGSPDDNLLTFTSNLLISGDTSPNSNVLISSNSQDLIVKSKSDGSFTTVIELKEGVNNISVTVFDDNGDQKGVDRTVYFSKEKL